MKKQSLLIGIVWAISTAMAAAQSSSYSAMAVPGEHNGWNTTPTMVKSADYTWVGTQTLSTASGSFKFAANGSWAVNWGGNFTIQYPPAWGVGSLVGNGGNISYYDLAPGQYVFTFHEQSARFDMAPVIAPETPTNVQVIGSFNGDGATSIGTMTNQGNNIWKTLIELDHGANFLFRVSSNSGLADRGSLAPQEISNLPFTNGNPAGTSRYTLDTAAGLYEFTYNLHSNVFSLSRTRTNYFTLSTVSAVGNFVKGNPPDVNLELVGGAVWRSDFMVTNASSFTLSFIGRDSSGDIGRYWGLGIAATSSLPATGYMLASSNNIFTNLTVTALPGNYRITLDAQSGAYSVIQRYRIPGPVNYIVNPSFEAVANGVPTDWEVYHATSGEQLDFGAHTGSRCGVLMRKNVESDWDLGNFVQSTPMLPQNSSGHTFRVSAALRTKGDWQASLVRLIVEWREGNTTIAESSQEIQGLSTQWKIYALEAVVPRDGLTAKILIKYDGDPGTGFLLVDDVEARFAASRQQDFNTWGAFNSFQRINPDWEATSGKAVYNLPANSPTGGVIISKYIEGTGNNKAIEIFNGTGADINLGTENFMLQQYNNGSGAVSTNIFLTGILKAGEALVVGRPATPAAYAPDPAIRATPRFLEHKGLTFNGDDVIVLRKGDPSSPPLDRVGRTGTNNTTGSVLAHLMTDHTLHRKSQVLKGNTNAVGSAFSLTEWEIYPKDTFTELGHHFFSVDDPDAPYVPTGYSLMLNTNASLITPELEEGIGDITFYARAMGAASGNNIQLVLETAPSLTITNWTVVDTISLPLTQTNFQRHTSFVSQSADTVLRIRHIADGTTNRVLIDDVFVDRAYLVRRSQNFDSWTNFMGAPIGTYTKAEWTIRSGTIGQGPYNSPSAFLYPDAGAVSSPTFQGGVGTLTFVLANISNELGEVRAEIHTSTNNWATWVTNSTVGFPGKTSIVTTNCSVPLFLPVSSSVRISANGSPSPFAVDLIQVGVPSIVRELTFNDLAVNTAYKSFIKDGWSVTDTAIANVLVATGNAGRLRNGTIVSPQIDDIGTISFSYKQSEFTGDDAARLKVEVSPNGSTWTAVTNGLVPSTNVQTFYYFNTNSAIRFVKISQTIKDKRILIDDIFIDRPTPMPSCTITAGLSPAAPAPNEGFYLTAEVIAQNNPDIIAVTGRYRIAAGAWTNVELLPMGFGSYRSANPLPPQNPGVQITYSAFVRYAGPGAAPGSTGYTSNTVFSTTNITKIMSVKKGTVWINEIFYAPYEDEDGGGGIWGDTPYNHEFVEICGVAGTSIAGWQVDLLFARSSDLVKNGGVARYASYKIPGGTVLSNSANGYGFYVIGDQELKDDGEKVDQVLTVLVPTAVNPYAVDDRDHIRDPAGIVRLLDDRSNVVYSLSYGAYDSSSDRLPVSQDPTWYNTNSLSLGGTGSTYDDFTWNKTGDLTIGEPNTGQTLTPDEGLPFMPAWHTPDATSLTRLQGSFTQFHPAHAAQSAPIFIHYAYTNASFPDYSRIGGKAHHHKLGSGSWSENVKIADFSGNEDTNGTGYAYARMVAIPSYTYQRHDTIEYVIEAIPPTNSGYATAYLGSDGAGSSRAYETLEEAKLYPFRYTFPIADQFLITSFVVSNAQILLQTVGNDPLDPIVHFNIRSTTNQLIPTGAWGIIEPQAVTRTNEQNYITFERPLEPNRFFAVQPLWP